MNITVYVPDDLGRAVKQAVRHGLEISPVCQRALRAAVGRINGEIERRQPPFVPPTLDEVREYCASKNYKLDPEAFVAHHEARGWMLGKVKMKNWRAACVTWEKNERSGRFGGGYNGRRPVSQAYQPEGSAFQRQLENLKPDKMG